MLPYLFAVFKENMIDLVYLIDGSLSHHQIGDDYTGQIKKVINFTLDYLPNPNTRVGVVLYAASVTTASYFNFTRNQTHQALGSLQYLPPGLQLGQSLNYTGDAFFNSSRSNAHRILVVFTGGTSNDAVNVASNLLREMNVTIIVVALGGWYDVTQVNSIASYPHSSTTLLTTHVEIVRLRWRVHEMICEGESNISNYHTIDCTVVASHYIYFVFSAFEYVQSHNSSA